MKYVNNLINLEINRPFLTLITAKQSDTARYLLFSILDNGVPFNLANKVVRAYVENGTNPIYDNLTIVDVEKGLCELKLSTSMLSAYGDKLIELTITEGTDTVSTMPFILRVVKSVKNDGAIQTTNEFSALTIALNQVDQWNTYFQNTNGQLEVKYTTRLTALEGEVRDTKATTISTNADITSLTGVVDGLLNVDKIYGKTLVNLSKFTSLTTTDLKYYTNLLDNTLIQNRIVTIINNTGRNIKVVVVNSTTGSFLREIPCNSQITNILTLGANESLSYFNGYKSDGWSEVNKNDLLKVMILDGTVNFVPSYFEGIKSVGEDNSNKIEISTCGEAIWGGKEAANDIIDKINNYNLASLDTIDGRNVLKLVGSAYNNNVIFNNFEPNTQYELKYDVKYVTRNGGILVIRYTDGTTTNVTPSNTWQTLYSITLQGKTVKQIEIVAISDGTTYIDYDKLMLIKTTTDVNYKEYKSDKSEISLSVPLCEWDWIDRVRNTVCRNSLSVVYDGSPDENWNVQQYTNLCAYITVPNLILGYTDSIRCNTFKLYDRISSQPNGTQGIANEGINASTAGFFIGIKGLATDVTSWKAWLQSNPITIVYRTSTETTEPISSKLNLNSYNNGYLSINSGAINPTIDVSYPCNIGERTKVAEDSILSLFAKLKSILPSQIIEDTLHRFMTDTERNKLNGIETNANNYTHPATHLASIINLTQGNLQTWVNNFVVQDCGNEYYILKFPGFQIHVSWSSVLQSTGVKHVNFYNAFQKCFGVVTTCSYSLTGACKPGYISNVSTTGFDLAIWDNASSGVDIAYYWIAIGR